MADIKYRGITTYIKQSEDALEKLEVFASAIPAFGSGANPILDINAIPKAKYNYIIRSEEYRTLDELEAFCFVQDYNMPDGTPEAYQQFDIEFVTIKGLDLIRVYIPMTSKREYELDNFTDAYVSIMKQLFASDVISIVAKTGIEYERFEDATTHQIISVNS